MTKDEDGKEYLVIFFQWYVVILNEEGNWTPNSKNWRNIKLQVTLKRNNNNNNNYYYYYNYNILIIIIIIIYNNNYI